MFGLFLATTAVIMTLLVASFSPDFFEWLFKKVRLAILTMADIIEVVGIGLVVNAITKIHDNGLSVNSTSLFFYGIIAVVVARKSKRKGE
jgi:uncharacterized membrane protein